MILSRYLLALVLRGWDVRYSTCMSLVCLDVIDPWASMQSFLEGMDG